MPAITTLAQLKTITSAFNDFVTVTESDLPEYYKEVFPHTCRCGSEVIMTRDGEDRYGYTQLQCCNPDCWVKMAHRFTYFAKALGYKGFGPASSLPLYAEFHSQFPFPTFLNIFKIPTAEIRKVNGDAYADDFDTLKRDLLEMPWTFKDAMASLGIPDVGKNCQLFDVVKDPRTMLGVVLKKQIPEVCQMAGIYAPKTHFYLDMARVDIVTLMSEVMPHIMATPKKEICVAITGSVSVEGKGLTRAEFIWKCEGLLDAQGSPVYKLVETKAESKLDYVIADHPSCSSKYKLGVRMKNLITADEFYRMLKENLGGGENDESA